MTTFSPVGSIASSAVETELQSAPPPAPAPTAQSENEDTVTISAANQQESQPTYAQLMQQVLQLSEDGQSVQQIAAALQISAQSVQSYLQGPIPPASAPSTDTTA